MTRTLKDYRPQHDQGCTLLSCPRWMRAQLVGYHGNQSVSEASASAQSEAPKTNPQSENGADDGPIPDPSGGERGLGAGLSAAGCASRATVGTAEGSPTSVGADPGADHPASPSLAADRLRVDLPSLLKEIASLCQQYRDDMRHPVTSADSRDRRIAWIDALEPKLASAIQQLHEEKTP